MVEANIQIIQTLKTFLRMIPGDIELRNCFIEKPTDFVRQRILTYERTVLLLINLLKKPWQLNYKIFFKIVYQMI